MSKDNKEQIIEEFTQAYQKAHGKKPEIEAKSGWYSVDGGKNMRIAQLEEMTKELQGESADTEEKKTASKAKSDSKPKAKSKPKATSKTKASPAKKSAKKKSGGFSVKDFYADKLQEENPGSTLPR